MSEDVVGGVVVAETITIWAGAEEWDSRRGKRAGSKSTTKSRSKAAGRSARSTQASSTQAGSAQAGFTQASSTRARSTQARSTLESAELRLEPKQLGEIAEAEFIARVVGLRFVAAKPWGDSESYDYIVNARRSFNFWRVQVKSAHVVGRDGTYSFGAHNGARKSYTAEDIDALVAYARPERAWYVLPVRLVEGLKALKLSPKSRKMRSKYEKYREAWDILRKPVRRKRKK
jgi:hypothetical protein